jgi:HK97 family phage prohead protease
MQTQATLITQAQTETNDGIIKGVANSLTRTRSGITVTQEAGKKVIGKKVPLLLSHDWSSMPIGEATMTSVDDDGLAYSGSIFESVSNRQQILDGINAGVLSVSIGFGVGEIDENNNIDDIDLLELSVTPVPADPKATITQSLEIINQENITMADNMKDKMKGKMADDMSDHEPSATPTDDNLLPALNPLYPEGTKITVLADHMAGMKGATGVVTHAYLANIYIIDYQPTDGSSEIKGHRWVTEDEIANQDKPNNSQPDNTDKPDDSQPDNATESVDELVSFVKKLSVSDNMQALRLGKILKKFDK